MTNSRPRQPPRPQSPPPDEGESVPKPYALIAFPKDRPPLKAPAGHHRYDPKRHHGQLDLDLTVKTGVHVATGLIVMGRDVGAKVPLIKTMEQDDQQYLLIPGSSLKGVIRSIYEAITNSTLGVVTNKYKRHVPRERMPCTDLKKRKDEDKKLCPASRVFGAMDWQGLVQFSDARCQQVKAITGFMPSLYQPRTEPGSAYFKGNQVAGRKFYYHAQEAVSGGERGIHMQQAGTEYRFRTRLSYHNLTDAELGTLLISLGQDAKYPLAIKVGGGKPIGMGTMTVTVAGITDWQKTIRDRYRSYASEQEPLIGDAAQALVQRLIKAAHQTKLVEKTQLEQLHEILKWPTERQAPEGVY